MKRGGTSEVVRAVTRVCHFYSRLFLAFQDDDVLSLLLGNYYSLRSQHDKAVLYFQRALKLNPNYLSAWTLVGHEYVEIKNTSAAIQAYRQAIGKLFFDSSFCTNQKLFGACSQQIEHKRNLLAVIMVEGNILRLTSAQSRGSLVRHIFIVAVPNPSELSTGELPNLWFVIVFLCKHSSDWNHHITPLTLMTWFKCGDHVNKQGLVTDEVEIFFGGCVSRGFV